MLAEIEHLREQHDNQHCERPYDHRARQGFARSRVGKLRLGPMGREPAADPGQQHDRGQREQGEGEDRPLPERHDDEGGEQRAGRLAEIAADLKQALGEAMPAARRRPGDARGLGMKDGAADADQRHRDKQQRISVSEGEADEADQRERHASRQQRVHRPAVGDETDERLQQRSGSLEHEGDDSGLKEAQRHLLAKHRIERRRQRLHDVVEHVRGADGHQHAERGGPSAPALRGDAFGIGRCGSHGSSPRAVRRNRARVPKNSRPPKRPRLVRWCDRLWALRSLIVNSGGGRLTA